MRVRFEPMQNVLPDRSNGAADLAINRAPMHFSQQRWRCRDRDYLPHDSRDVETNAPVSQHGKQMKEDAAAGETCEGRHVTDRAERGRTFLLESIK